MEMELQTLAGVTKLAHNFRGVLLDAYGVFWGGNASGVLPNTADTMAKLVSAGKIVGILSNSTQLVSKEKEKLARHGIHQGSHFHFMVTSGEVARHILMHEKLPFETPRNTYWLLGGIHPKFSSHLDIFEGTRFKEVSTPAEADFVYISIPHKGGEDQTDAELFREEIAAINLSLPMVCTNPDYFAHEGSPPIAVVRQGSMAKIYESLGGKVFYIGKPDSKAFYYAMLEFDKFQVTMPREILMVGDTPETDIRGGHQFGMSTALIMKTGLMADRIAKQGMGKALISLPIQDIPDFFIEGLYDDL